MHFCSKLRLAMRAGSTISPPETKATSMAWKHITSSIQKKFNTTNSAGKVLLTVFWDAEGVLLLDFLEQGRG
jgi:hypothetical protein